MILARYRVGIFPFPTKSLRFGTLAYRTIALRAVLFVEWVAHLAGNFKSILSSRRIRVVKGVFSNSDTAEVGGVNATSIGARVIYDHSQRNRPISEVVSNTVSSSGNFPEKKGTIPVPIKGRSPQVAFSDLSPLAVESIKFFFSKAFHRFSSVSLYALSITWCHYASV